MISKCLQWEREAGHSAVERKLNGELQWNTPSFAADLYLLLESLISDCPAFTFQGLDLPVHVTMTWCI